MHRLGCFPVIENAMINSSFPYKRKSIFVDVLVRWKTANLVECMKVTPLGASVTVCHSNHEAIISWVEAWPLGWGMTNTGVAIDSASSYRKPRSGAGT